MKQHFIILLNEKGGVGKTSAACTLASLLGLAGKKTLLIDNDPQMNASMTVLDGGTEIKNDISSVFSAAMKSPVNKDTILSAVYPTKYRNLSVIPSSSRHRNTVNMIRNAGPAVVHQLILNKAMRALSELNFEYIIVDDHPSLTEVEVNSLFLGSNMPEADTTVLVPAGTDLYSYSGLSPLAETVTAISSDEYQNPGLKMRIFLSRAEAGTKDFRDFTNAYQKMFEDAFLTIPVQMDSSMAQSAKWDIPLSYLYGQSGFYATSRPKALFDCLEILYTGLHDFTLDDYLLTASALLPVTGLGYIVLGKDAAGHIFPAGVSIPAHEQNAFSKSHYAFADPLKAYEILPEKREEYTALLHALMDDAKYITVEEDGRTRKMRFSQYLKLTGNEEAADE